MLIGREQAPPEQGTYGESTQARLAGRQTCPEGQSHTGSGPEVDVIGAPLELSPRDVVSGSPVSTPTLDIDVPDIDVVPVDPGTPVPPVDCGWQMLLVHTNPLSQVPLP